MLIDTNVNKHKKQTMKHNFINQFFRVFGVDDALLAAGVTALAAGGQMYANSKMNKKAIKFNKEMYDKQRADALSNFDRVNAYNTPEQQMRRFREAGLNPHLMYSNGGSTSNAAPIGQAQAQVPQLQAPNIHAMAAGAVNTYMETQSFKAQQAYTNAQTLKVLAETNRTNFTLEQQQRLADTQATLLKNINIGQEIKNTNDVMRNEREEKQNAANLELLDVSTKQKLQEVSQDTTRFHYELLQKSQDLKKTAQEIINLRIDATTKKLDQQLKDGEITRQFYEKETNRLDQMLKDTQRRIMQEGKDFKSSEDAMQWINTALGVANMLKK